MVVGVWGGVSDGVRVVGVGGGVTLQVGGLVLGGGLLVVNHALDDAVDRVQQVGVLAHGQHSVDLGVQQVVAEEETCTPSLLLYVCTSRPVQLTLTLTLTRLNSPEVSPPVRELTLTTNPVQHFNWAPTLRLLHPDAHNSTQQTHLSKDICSLNKWTLVTPILFSKVYS